MRPSQTHYHLVSMYYEFTCSILCSKMCSKSRQQFLDPQVGLMAHTKPSRCQRPAATIRLKREALSSPQCNVADAILPPSCYPLPTKRSPYR